MIKIGEVFTKNGIKYTIDSIEPSKILEIASKENPIMVSYSIKNKRIFNNRVVVNVKTQEEWNSVIKIKKYRFHETSRFDTYAVISCINLNEQSFGFVDWYLNCSHEVISYDEFLLNHSVTISLKKFKSLF